MELYGGRAERSAAVSPPKVVGPARDVCRVPLGQIEKLGKGLAGFDLYLMPQQPVARLLEGLSPNPPLVVGNFADQPPWRATDCV